LGQQLGTKNWCFRNNFRQDSIPPQHLELDQYQSFDKLASFSFKKIELGYECDPDPQVCYSILIFESILTLMSLPYLDPFPKPTLIPIHIKFEFEPLILDSHISLMRKECEIQFF